MSPRCHMFITIEKSFYGRLLFSGVLRALFDFGDGDDSAGWFHYEVKLS